MIYYKYFVHFSSLAGMVYYFILQVGSFNWVPYLSPIPVLTGKYLRSSRASEESLDHHLDSFKRQ